MVTGTYIQVNDMWIFRPDASEREHLPHVEGQQVKYYLGEEMVPRLTNLRFRNMDQFGVEPSYVSFHQGTGKVPILALEKEKNFLHPLPAERVRSSYRIQHKLVKINASNMIPYQSRQYSVPTGYQGKTVGIQVYDNHLYVYYNTKLLVRHPIGEAKLNYTEEHYREHLQRALPSYPDIDDLAKKNLRAIGGVFE